MLIDVEGEPTWPDARGRRVVFLLDAATALEHRILEGWIRRHQPEGQTVDVVDVPPSRGRRRGKGPLGALEVTISQGDDPLLAPLRVVWLPPKREDGTRVVSLRDVLLRGPLRPVPEPPAPDPAARPRPCHARQGEPAPLELRARWRDGAGEEDTPRRCRL
jgi:glycerol-3-phosphate O-acyltransferase